MDMMETVQKVAMKVLKAYGIWFLICIGMMILVWLFFWMRDETGYLDDLDIDQDLADDFFNDHGYTDDHEA